MEKGKMEFKPLKSIFLSVLATILFVVFICFFIGVFGGSTEKIEEKETIFCEGFVSVQLGDKWGYINKKGKLVINAQFDSAEKFDEKTGLAVVSNDGYYGYINKKGEYVIEPKYEGAEPFSDNGLAPVCVDGRWGYINKKGEIAIIPRFYSVGPFSKSGIAYVQMPYQSLVAQW